MPQVSVIIPVHNGEARLRQNLGSITGQTLRDIEIIVVDDASTDATAAIIKEFMAADSRISCVDGPGIGSASAARNVGLDHATGDYLAILDADDFFAPTLLEKLYTRACEDDADVVITKFRTVDQDTGEVTLADWAVRVPDLPPTLPFSAEDMGDHLFLAVNPAAWNKLFRAEFVRRSGVRFQNLKRADDLFFTYMALALAQRISIVDGYLIDYYVGNANSLEGSLHQSPTDFVGALDLLRSGLQEAGLLERCERAFVNVAAEVCLRNLNKVKTAAAFVEIHRALQSSVYRRLGIEGREPDYFLRQYLAVQVEMTSKSSSEELLFSWLQEAEKATALSEKLREAALRANAARSAGLPSPAEMEAAEPAAHDPAAPDVSVIIPVYNTDEYLTSCIGSVLAQTGVDLEVICVDDGSTDLSGAVLDQLAAGDTRITVIHQANLGQSVARNRGIDAAKGRYLCFVDSDDWWQEDSLAELVEWADNERLDLVLFDASTVREPGVTDETWESFRTYYERSAYVGVRSGPELLGAMRARSEYVVSPCLYLIRADRLHRSGLRFYPGIVHEDNLFTFELMLGAGRAGHSQTRLYSRRLRPGSTMTAGSQLASAQGYLISYLEMVRLAGRTMYPQATTSAVAKIMFSTLKGVYSSYAALDTEGVRRLEEVDPSPEAQALLLLLKHWRSLARSKGRSGRPSKPPADAPPSTTGAVADGTPAKRTPAPVRPRSILERGTARVRRIARQIVRGWQRS